MLRDSVNQSLHPRIDTDASIRVEVEDFLDRHGDAIAKAIKEPDVVHDKLCSNGKRVWRFNRYWPFIHTWINTAACVCEVNQLMRGNREMQRHIDDIVAILDSLKD